MTGLVLRAISTILSIGITASNVIKNTFCQPERVRSIYLTAQLYIVCTIILFLLDSYYMTGISLKLLLNWENVNLNVLKSMQKTAVRSAFLE